MDDTGILQTDPNPNPSPNHNQCTMTMQHCELTNKIKLNYILV